MKLIYSLLAIGYHESTVTTSIEWKIEPPPISENGASKRNGKKRQLQKPSFFQWFLDKGDPGDDPIACTIINDLWISPLQYYEDENAISADPEDTLAYLLGRCSIPDLIACH